VGFVAISIVTRLKRGWRSTPGGRWKMTVPGR
jgi:hypothetical protein